MLSAHSKDETSDLSSAEVAALKKMVEVWRMKKRDPFNELSGAIGEIQQHKAGKITLRQYEVKEPAKLEVTPEVIRETREGLNISRAVFAHQLHVSPRTLEKWEQGRSKPNDQAAALILLVRKYPDTIQRLKTLAA
jgi:putative transcriptional regulator